MFSELKRLFRTRRDGKPVPTFYKWPFMFNPRQLSFFCDCVEKTKGIPGSILEIGCYTGTTTMFLNKYMDCSGIEKEYIAMDTFSGFSPDDIKFERTVRNPKFSEFHYEKAFTKAEKKHFDTTMKMNKIYRVKSIQADVKKFDFNALDKLSFCIIDVDLYLPVKAALNGVYNLMGKGGIIAVDDCYPNCRWDGSLQAYKEFVKSHRLEEHIILDKLGIIHI